MANVQDIMNEIDRIENAKGELVEAIGEKGVEVPAEAHIQQFPSYVRAIPTSIEEFFKCIYGTTPANLILNALSENKFPIVSYQNRLYIYHSEQNGKIYFITILSKESYFVSVDESNDAWSNDSAELYEKPTNGIPDTDLSQAVQDAIALALTAYQKPAAGIPASDLADKYAGSPSAGGPALKALGMPFGEVDSGSTATALNATVDNFPSTLTDGVMAYIRNDIVNSASGFTLNVNGTGAKPVYATNADATRITTQFSAATTYLFVYNSTRVSGGCWDMYYGLNTNDNTIGYDLRTNGITAVAASKFYRYRMLFTSPDGLSLVPANTSTSINAETAKAVNQDKIDPFGPIWYYSNTTEIDAGAGVGASYLWLQRSAIPFGYSFNRTEAALTLTPKAPVFIKCAPQSDGSAIIDADTPYVQALPSTDDGKIYIFLGYADSATAVTLYYWHPVYYHKFGAIRLWTNKPDVDGKWGVVSQTVTYASNNSDDRTYSDKVEGLIPQTAIDMYEAVGAIFNSTGETINRTTVWGATEPHLAGCFYLNGLGDISYQEMAIIYAECISSYSAGYWNRVQCCISTRTNLVRRYEMNEVFQNIYYVGGDNLRKCDNIRVVVLPGRKGEETVHTSNHSFKMSAAGSSVFFGYNCSKLQYVVGAYDASNNTSFAQYNLLNYCTTLKFLMIDNLKASIRIASQWFRLDCIVFMVDNAANTSAITITLHADAYARCQADTTEYTYEGQTYTGILAYASAKNITIASA